MTGFLGFFLGKTFFIWKIYQLNPPDRLNVCGRIDLYYTAQTLIFKAALERVSYKIPPTFSCGIIHAVQYFIRLIFLRESFWLTELT